MRNPDPVRGKQTYKLDAAQKKRLVEAVLAGIGVRPLSVRFGVTRAMVWYHMVKAGHRYNHRTREWEAA